jgi:hypothetical protein
LKNAKHAGVLNGDVLPSFEQLSELRSVTHLPDRSAQIGFAYVDEVQSTAVISV